MRACVFCDRRDLTLEHALPSWLMELLSEDSHAAHILMTIGTDTHRSFVSRGKNLGVKVKHVCRVCNNGWMSRLEKRASPYLRGMIRDLSITLDSDAQATIAAWMAKTVMVFECIALPRAWYSAEERRLFMETLKPPDGTAIWIGRGSQTGWSSTITRTIEFGPGWPFQRGAVATFALGHLVFQVLSVRKVDNDNLRGTITFRSTNVPDPWAHRMFLCWPTQAGVQVWPPRSDAAADAKTA